MPVRSPTTRSGHHLGTTAVSSADAQPTGTAPTPDSAPSTGHAPPDPAANAALTGVASDFVAHHSDASTPVRGPSHPGLTARHDLHAQPIDPTLYGGIVDELQHADWQGCGIAPLRYVEDRLDRQRFLDPLLQDSDARVVLHRRAFKLGQAPGVDTQGARSVSRRPSRDWPGDVYRDRDGTFHIVGIPGEDWTTQTLYMLAAAGVGHDKVLVEGSADLAGLAAADLNHTLKTHDFDSVVIGTIGGVTRAIERSLRQREQPAHTGRCLTAMQSFLDDRAVHARADKRPRWQDRQQRLGAIRAAGGTPAEQIAAIEADPDLGSALAEQLRAVRDGAEVKDLPLSWKNGKARVFSHRVLEVEDKKHLLIHIGGAHGDLAHAAVAQALKMQPDLGKVALFDTCGSFDGAKLPPDSFVRPASSFASIEPGRPTFEVENLAAMPGAIDVKHSNVATLLREHKAGLAELEASGDTVDIEAWHVARAVAEARTGGRVVELRAILRVSDVADDVDLGAHRDDRQASSDYDGRRVGEEIVVQALGLLDKLPGGTP